MCCRSLISELTVCVWVIQGCRKWDNEAITNIPQCFIELCSLHFWSPHRIKATEKPVRQFQHWYCEIILSLPNFSLSLYWLNLVSQGTRTQVAPLPYKQSCIRAMLWWPNSPCDIVSSLGNIYENLGKLNLHYGDFHVSGRKLVFRKVFLNLRKIVKWIIKNLEPKFVFWDNDHDLI